MQLPIQSFVGAFATIKLPACSRKGPRRPTFTLDAVKIGALTNADGALFYDLNEVDVFSLNSDGALFPALHSLASKP